MQDFIDIITNNLAFFVGMFIAGVFVAGFAIALSTASGRDALARAAVRFAVAALAMAERWLGREIDAHVEARAVPPVHPVAQARADLQSWLR